MVCLSGGRRMFFLSGNLSAPFSVKRKEGWLKIRVKCTFPDLVLSLKTMKKDMIRWFLKRGNAEAANRQIMSNDDKQQSRR